MNIKAFMVSGCGVSALCYDAESIVYWVRMIVDRGGIPEFQEIKGGNVNDKLIGG